MTRRVAGLLAIAAVMSLTTALFVAFALGWQLRVVRTGSMEPAHPVGSLAIVTPVDPADLGPGRSVVFSSPTGSGNDVSHRVVRRVIRRDGLYLETRGDANPGADPFLVPARSVRGTVRWSIPRVGWLIGPVAQPSIGLGVAVVAAAALVASEVMRRRRATGPDLLVEC